MVWAAMPRSSSIDLVKEAEYVRDKKGGELELLLVPCLYKLLRELHGLLPELVKAYGLDLAYAELFPLCLEDLEVASDDRLRPPALQARGRAEDLLAKRHMVEARALLEPADHFPVPCRRCRGLQYHGIREDAREQKPGYLLFKWRAGPPEELCHKGGCRAHRLADEWYWQWAGEVAYPVVVHALDYVHLLRAVDRLRELVMVYEHEVQPGGLQYVGLGDDALHDAAAVEDYEPCRYGCLVFYAFNPVS